MAAFYIVVHRTRDWLHCHFYEVLILVSSFVFCPKQDIPKPCAPCGSLNCLLDLVSSYHKASLTCLLERVQQLWTLLVIVFVLLQLQLRGVGFFCNIVCHSFGARAPLFCSSIICKCFSELKHFCFHLPICLVQTFPELWMFIRSVNSCTCMYQGCLCFFGLKGASYKIISNQPGERIIEKKLLVS